MFSSDDILYEDNHLLVVNKRCGDLVQPDPSGQSALEDQIKAYIKRRDAKPARCFSASCTASTSRERRSALRQDLEGAGAAQ